MLGFVTVGTNNLKEAGIFYDAVFDVLGAKRSQEGERIIMWSGKSGTGSVAVITPFDKAPATAGNGTMLSLDAGNPKTVQAVHAKAIEMGATNDGAPGHAAQVIFMAATSVTWTATSWSRSAKRKLNRGLEDFRHNSLSV